MGDIIRQRYEVYEFHTKKIWIPKRGEKITITSTDEYGAGIINLIGDGKKTVQLLYESWNNGDVSPFRTEKEQDKIDTAIKKSVTDEAQARQAADAQTLQDAMDYTDSRVLAEHQWLVAVKDFAQLPLPSGLDTKINYLCRVMSTPNDKKGVWELVAGASVWTFYSDNEDWIDDLELEERITEHNEDESEDTHPSIHRRVANEEQERITADVNLQTQIDALTPEGLGNLPEQLAEIPKKAPINHASPQTEYGEATDNNYGHMKFPKSATTGNSPIAALPYKYNGAAQVYNLNDFRTAGIYVLYNPSAGSLNFPEGWGTGTSNSAILVVVPFYSNTAVKQIFYNRGSVDEYTRISTSATAWGNGWVSKFPPIGDISIQYPGQKSPTEKGWPGSWTNWGSRAVLYGVSTSIPSYTVYAAGINIVSGNYYLYTEKNGDKRIYLANEAITGAPAVLDPVKFTRLQDVTTYKPVFVSRSDIQSSWTAADLAIGATISSAPVSTHNGKRITEIICPAGYYFAIAGGNRPTFESGVAGDMIREILGVFRSGGGINFTGPFKRGASLVQRSDNSGQGGVQQFDTTFDSSLVVPTGPENSPVTLSCRYWRRTSSFN